MWLLPDENTPEGLWARVAIYASGLALLFCLLSAAVTGLVPDTGKSKILAAERQPIDASPRRLDSSEMPADQKRTPTWIVATPKYSYSLPANARQAREAISRGRALVKPKPAKRRKSSLPETAVSTQGYAESPRQRLLFPFNRETIP